jgi:hypothetical protein
MLLTLAVAAVVVVLGWTALSSLDASRDAYPQEARESRAGAWMYGTAALLFATWATCRVVVLVRWIRGGTSAS